MDEKDNKQQPPAAASTMKFPKRPLIWTLFAVVVIGVLALSGDSLNENFEWQPGFINIVKVVMVFLTAWVWIIWLAFFSGHRARFLMTAIVISLVALFFYRFRLVFDGDMGFDRIESRFVERTYDVVRQTGKETDLASADLSQTSHLDFNQFLGNDRDGIVRGRVLNSDWTSNPPEIVWKKSVGEGWSGFSAVNGFAVTQEQRGQQECVTCYEVETGELKWIYAADRRHEDTMSFGRVGPRATPSIDDGKVYAQGATGVLDCLDGKNGNLLWSVDIAKLLGIEMTEAESTRGYKYQYENTKQSTLAWGRSGSPVIYKDKVIATGGIKQDGSCDTLIAFDKETGTEIWRGGDRMIAYGSPSIENLVGTDQVTLVAEDAAMGFDPDNGKVLWEALREGTSNADANCSQVTRINEFTVLLSKGYAMGGELVRLTKKEQGIQPTTIWKDPRVLKTKMTSPVILGEYAYCLSDGFLECTHISQHEDTRKRIWRKRGRFGNGQLLLVGNFLLVHTEYGKLKLIEATPDAYNELGEIETVEGICWNTICLYDNFLLVRSELEAACIRLKLDSREDPSAAKETVSAPGRGQSTETTDETNDER